MTSPSVIERRRARLQELHCRSADLIIIGGGIHGCAAAREASLQGLSVLLFEADDIGSGTSSRSSKMLHGGVRYLEQGDISLVFEALRERSVLLKIAAPFARTQRFLFPVVQGKTKPAWQIRIGLSLYDFLAKFGYEENSLRGHSELRSDSVEAGLLRTLGLSFTKLFSYFDGQMDDARICLEMALDAFELGATVVNHTKVTGVGYSSADKQWLVQWKSEFPSEVGESRAAVILDLRGPELVPLSEQTGSESVAMSSAMRSVVLSRGSHLLFNMPWKLPGITLPTGIPGRYYFVWPYFCSHGDYTLVGTTDLYRPIAQHDPVASKEEIAELLSYLKRDLPESRLDESTLYQTYCGVRSLVRSRAASVDSQNFPRTSRSHQWFDENRYITLVGGKYTSARHTATQGVQRVLTVLERAPKTRWTAGVNRELPGARGWSDSAIASITSEITQKFAVAESVVAGVMSRHGMFSRRLLEPEYPDSSLLQSEVQLCVREEFAVTVEDVLRRRLNLSLIPGAGTGHLPDIQRALIASGRDRSEVEEEGKRYLSRWTAK